MSDDYQIDIPASFFAIYIDASRRLKASLATVRARYEVCEDLATHLVQHAQVLHHTEVPSENDILLRIHVGLASPDAGVSGPEAGWIVQRLAELLGWQCPAPNDPAATV